MGCLSVYEYFESIEQSRRLLEYVEDNFLMQLMREPIRGSMPLDLLFMSREGMVGEVVVGNCLGCSDRKMNELSVLVEVGHGKLYRQ